MAIINLKGSEIKSTNIAITNPIINNGNKNNVKIIAETIYFGVNIRAIMPNTFLIPENNPEKS